MTNEEAVVILKGAIKKPNTEDGYLGQALAMAIKALEKQPCKDCVSRSYMIDVIRDKIKDVPKNANGTYQRDNGMFVNGLYMALELVTYSPSVQSTRPKGKWIPMQVSSGSDSWKCSICGRRSRGKLINLPFCHCGADMRESEVNDDES